MNGMAVPQGLASLWREVSLNHFRSTEESEAEVWSATSALVQRRQPEVPGAAAFRDANAKRFFVLFHRPSHGQTDRLGAVLAAAFRELRSRSQLPDTKGPLHFRKETARKQTVCCFSVSLRKIPGAALADIRSTQPTQNGSRRP